MNSVDLIKEIMQKTSLSVEKLAKRVDIKEKVITDFLNGKSKLEIEEYLKIGKYFNLSLDTLVTGKPTEHDEYTMKKLKPSKHEVIDNIIEKWKSFIISSGLGNYMDQLLPTPIFENTSNGQKFNGFSGGVFQRTEGRTLDIKEKDVSLAKILKLDNFEIYEAFKKNGATFYKSGGFYGYQESKYLELEDIVNLEDIRFFENFDLKQDGSDYLSNALYIIPDTNKKYWKILDIFLKKGAFLVKGELPDLGRTLTYEEMIDYPATQMLRYITTKNLK